MKRILIAASLSGIFMPTPASAELNYNTVNVGFTTKTATYKSASVDYTELSLGFSKSVSKNVYLGATYERGSEPTTATNDGKVQSISLGAGFHTPLYDNADVIVVGHIVQGTDQIATSSANANGYDVGAGIRSQFTGGLEGSIAAVYASTSNDTYSSKDTFVTAQFGFDFTPEIQLYAGIDLWRENQTIDFGLRYFY
jgi:opacity protein-like surface antigen